MFEFYYYFLHPGVSAPSSDEGDIVGLNSYTGWVLSMSGSTYLKTISANLKPSYFKRLYYLKRLQ